MGNGEPCVLLGGHGHFGWAAQYTSWDESVRSPLTRGSISVLPYICAGRLSHPFTGFAVPARLCLSA